jgi:osmotically-inducible protein OsmY
MNADRKIERDIWNEFAWEPGLDDRKILAGVDDGVVLLTGQVPTIVERNRVEAAVLRVPGVRAIADELVVESATDGRPSMDMARAALTALRKSIGEPSDRLKIVVRGGVVRLDGEVESEDHKQIALRTLGELPGVRDVLSMAVVRPAECHGCSGQCHPKSPARRS